MHDPEELKRLFADLALIAQQIKQDNQQAAQQFRQGIAESLRTFETQATGVVKRAAHEAISRCSEGLEHSAQKADWAAQALGDQRKLLTGSQQSLVYLSLVALLVGSTLAAGAAWYGVNSSREEVARNRVQAQLLQAINRADVTLCEGGRLCANVDERGKRQGDQRQYRPVRPR